MNILQLKTTENHDLLNLENLEYTNNGKLDESWKDDNWITQYEAGKYLLPYARDKLIGMDDLSSIIDINLHTEV